MLSICTSLHPKQLWTECSFRVPSSSSSEWAHMHLLIVTLLDTHDMDMSSVGSLAIRNLCRCFSRRSQSSSQEMTCAHLNWCWTCFLASLWFFKDAWTKSGSSIEISREILLLLRYWQSKRPMLGLIVLMTNLSSTRSTTNFGGDVTDV